MINSVVLRMSSKSENDMNAGETASKEDMSTYSPELSPSATMVKESAVAVEEAPERRHSVEAAGRLVAEANSRSSRGEVPEKVDAEQMEGPKNDYSPQKRLHEHDGHRDSRPDHGIVPHDDVEHRRPHDHAHHYHHHGHHHHHHHDPVLHDHDVFPHHNAMHEVIPEIANEVDPMVHTDFVHEHGHHDTFHQDDFHHDRIRNDVPRRYREDQFATTSTTKRQLLVEGDDERSYKTVNFNWVTNRGAIRGVA